MKEKSWKLTAFLCSCLSLVLIQKVHTQTSSSLGTDFFIGFLQDIGEGQLFGHIRVIIGTPSSMESNVIIRNLHDGDPIEIMVTSTQPQTVEFDPLQLQSFDISQRDRGLHIHSEDYPIYVIAEHFIEFLNYGTFLAYPRIEIESATSYKYFVMSAPSPSSADGSATGLGAFSHFLLVGNDDDTIINIRPSQDLPIPLNTQESSANMDILAGVESHDITLNSMQTLYLSSVADLTGTRITSNKPLTVITGHSCAEVPSGAADCEPFAVHVPPYATWGTQFLLAPFAGRDTALPSVYRFVSAEPTSVSISCSGNEINATGEVEDFLFLTPPHSFCALESYKPILLVQKALGVEMDPSGDPAITLVSPVDQYISEAHFVSLPEDDFPETYISVTVGIEHFDPQNILLDGTEIDCSWEQISLLDGNVVGYGCNALVESNSSSPLPHNVTHNSGGAISVIVNGFHFDPEHGYAYLAGQAISVSEPEGIFIPFIDLTTFPGVKELNNSVEDSFSEPINIPDGLLFGEERLTTAYVNENGVISFKEPWQYSIPEKFPTEYLPSRLGFAIAAFWSDNDIRRDGAVRYITYSAEETDNPQGAELLSFINDYIQRQQNETEEPFVGQWMLVAHWDGVHPSPHGQDDRQGIPDDILNQTNNYQAILVTDIVTTIVLYSYDIQWSSVGTGPSAVVGFNAGGEFFDNHPLSGMPDIGCAVNGLNCFSGATSKRREGNINNNPSLPFLPTNPILRAAVLPCVRNYNRDRFFLSTSPTDLAMNLEPCPCLAVQARDDCGRFRPQNIPGRNCYESTRGIPAAIRGSTTGTALQQCCYDPRGFLITDPNNGFAGTLTIDSARHDDEAFRDMCCNIAGQPDFCRLYHDRRPINTCTGPGPTYEAPVIGVGWGDPHYTTFDGLRYDFQGSGQFTLLELLQPNVPIPVFTIQGCLLTPLPWSTRVTGHLGLAFGDPDFAFHIGEPGGFRVYQTRPTLMEREITSMLSGTPIEFADRISLSRSGNELRVCHYDSGTRMSVGVFSLGGTEYYMDFRVYVPKSYMGNTRALLGNFDGMTNNEWFFNNPPMYTPVISPSSIQLFNALNTWSIAGSADNFLLPANINRLHNTQAELDPIFFEDLDITADIIEACGDNHECQFDLAVTGDMTVAMNTLQFDNESIALQEQLDNFPPVKTSASSDTLRVIISDVFVTSYQFTMEDPNGDDFTVTFQGGVVNAFSELNYLANPGNFSYDIKVTDVSELNVLEPLVFTATDSRGAISSFVVMLEVCACQNLEDCTADGILGIETTVVLNCNCGEAYIGRFCEEDRNGCGDIQCADGTTCNDVPAPGIGAMCTECPSGFRGDDQKCYDIDECSEDETLCEQICVNIPGDYFCACIEGYELQDGGNCTDIDECTLGLHNCQQECVNEPGNFNCDCGPHFTLNSDGMSCTVVPERSCDLPCPNGLCQTVNFEPRVEECLCNSGYELDGSGLACVDVNECAGDHPCDHNCIDLDGTFECSCEDGYTLQPNGTTCTDIDECFEAALQNIDLCLGDSNARCVNTPGSFDCGCVPGYSLVLGLCQRIVCPALDANPDSYSDLSYSTPPTPDGEYVAGTRATYICAEHRQLIDEPSRICGDNGQWSGTEPICQLVTCEGLNPPALGSISFTQVDDGVLHALSTATYSCDTGYRLSGGDEVSTCLSELDEDDMLVGVWNGTEPTCELIDCGEPEAPENGQIQFTSTLFGSTAVSTCSDGFTMNDPPTQTCGADGNWFPDTPHCIGTTTPNQCPPLEVPMNALAVVYTMQPLDQSTDYPVGTIAIYQCVFGATFDSNRLFRSCESGGVWSGEEIVCTVEQVGCSDIPDPAFGNINFIDDPDGISPFSVGTMAMYECDRGYTLVGATTTRVCEDGAQSDDWSGEAPECEPITCPPVMSPSNGSVTFGTNPDASGDYSFMTIAQFSCDGGFGLSGPATIACSEDGVFFPDSPSCLAITCPALDIPLNSVIQYLRDADQFGSYPFGTSANYVCNDGHILRGSEVRFCAGDDSSTEGYWDGDENTYCEEITCSGLNAPENGQVSFSSNSEGPYDLGVVASYSCDDGFSLEYGDEMRTCEHDIERGLWSGTEPQCVGTCQPLTVPADAEPIQYSTDPDENDEYLADTEAVFTCKDGFQLFGDEARTCQNNMTWSGTQPACLIACSSLPGIEYGNISYSSTPNVYDSYSVGTSATYECDDYFKLSGVDTRLCGTDMEWSGESPVCEPIMCPDIPDPDNGNILFSEEDTIAPFELGTEAYYVCKYGYALVGGDSTRHCIARPGEDVGEWNGTESSCELITCPGFPTSIFVANITYSNDPSFTEPSGISHYPFDTEATHICQDGYRVVTGDLIRVCSYGDGVLGEWTGDFPVCEEIVATCPDIPNPAKGRIDFSPMAVGPFREGASATYVCDLGYRLEGGDEVRTCEMVGFSPVGVWSGEAPYCAVDIPCPPLDAPVNGSIQYPEDVGGLYGFGAKVTYSCSVGLGLSGEVVRVCGPYYGYHYDDLVGKWSGDAPTCEVIRCPDIADPYDGQIEFSPDRKAPFDYGTQAQYSCDDGYALTGADSLRVCTGDSSSNVGYWTGEDLACVMPPSN